MSSLPSLVEERQAFLTQLSGMPCTDTAVFATQHSADKVAHRNETGGLRHKRPCARRQQLPQPHPQSVSDYYRLNGSYPGGMGSMQQEFAQMDVGRQQMRYIDLMQERDLMKYGTNDGEQITLPPSVCNPDARCSPRWRTFFLIYNFIIKILA
ncbi:unnamed protein product [Gongylonema pulchrum]|uniref:Uncharacterized protein n=1 Tax=Gongylonema pulchrum TaxID=637853 RepID=A0A183E4Y5_9BILA|nr:unnamed protein product [Gongylonema pulchrum]